MNKIIENYTNKILDIWKNIVNTPVLYICFTFSYFLIRISKVIWNCTQINRRNRENDDLYLFILKPCDLKFGMHVVKTLFYFMIPADNTYYTYF